MIGHVTAHVMIPDTSSSETESIAGNIKDRIVQFSSLLHRDIDVARRTRVPCSFPLLVGALRSTLEIRMLHIREAPLSPWSIHDKTKAIASLDSSSAIRVTYIAAYVFPCWASHPEIDSSPFAGFV